MLLHVFPQSLEERVADLPFGRLGPIFDLGEQLRLHQMPLWAIRFAYGCVFRDNALQSDLAGVLEHLAAFNLKAFAELDLGAVDDLLEFGLALQEWQLPEVAAVQVQQVEGDQYDAGRPAFQFVPVVPSAAGTTTSPSTIADPALMCQAASATFLKRLVQS